MSDEWLWSGAPPEDPDDARIAAALGSLSHERPCPPLPDRPAAPSEPAPAVVPEPRRTAKILPFHRRTVARVGIGLALAAGLALALLPHGDAWEVRTLAGSRPCALGPCRLHDGQVLAPPDGAQWEIVLDDLGTVRLAGGARLARLATDDGHLLRLDQGDIDVAVTAAARDVRVVTPSALVVDLGCAYALSVTPDTTRLSVADGSVSLETDEGVSIVTAGSVAKARAGYRPELPVRADAPAALVSAVRALEARDPTMLDATVADALIVPARAQDLFTLWHALQLVPGEPRARILAAIEARIPGLHVDHDAVLRLDADALTALWQAIVPVALAEPAIAGPW